MLKQAAFGDRVVSSVLLGGVRDLRPDRGRAPSRGPWMMSGGRLRLRRLSVEGSLASQIYEAFAI